MRKKKSINTINKYRLKRKDEKELKSAEDNDELQLQKQ